MHRGHGSSAVPPQKVFERVITILIGLITHPAAGRVFSAYALTDNTLIITIRRVSYLIGKLQNIDYEIIESERYYVKKYDNGYFESDFKTQVSPELGNPLTFQPLASGQTLFYRARITNMGIGIKVTEIYSLELTAQNNGIIWPVSPSMNANMEAVDAYVIQQGSDNTRTTTIRGRVTGKWK